MTRELLLLTYILTIFLTSCGQTRTETKNQEQQTNSYKVDNSVIAILPFDTNQSWVFENHKPADLTSDDLLEIEIILNNFIKDHNPIQERRFKEINDIHPEYKLDKNNFIIDLNRYKRQYVATTNTKGEKEVWVNCFCNISDKSWKTNLIFVLDGGNCYFNLKTNLTTGEYYELMVNGDA